MCKKNSVAIVMMILVIITLTSVATLLISGQFTKTPELQIATPNPVLPTTEATKPIAKPTKSADLETYTTDQFEFQYPSILKASKNLENVVITHSIPYDHPDPCDFKGDGGPLKDIKDFNVSIALYNLNMKETLKKTGSDYLIEEIYKNDEITTFDSFEEYKVGTLVGYKQMEGVEGCGQYKYYFPISATQTLFVNRAFVTELLSISLDAESNMKLPGIIIPDKEEEYLNQILTSFKMKS